ncbi:unnamed protein product, partial [marine sediment metagenome]
LFIDSFDPNVAIEHPSQQISSTHMKEGCKPEKN